MLQDIERSAGTAFADIGMTAVAEDEPPTLDALDGYRAGGRAWVATDPAGRLSVSPTSSRCRSTPTAPRRASGPPWSGFP